ncbi:MAG: hypothetical protein H7175_28605 [Burkholderiales bacterium]|nr:hypothetical protein [Anaerolineae bacterium]
MSSDSNSKVREFMGQVQEKMRTLVEEFALGNLSREQFHVIYDKYNTQLSIVEHALRGADPETVMGIAQDGPPTIKLREGYTAKALGMVIYSNRNGTVIETLGEFDVAADKISTVLNDLSHMMQANKMVERQVKKISNRHWLAFMPARYTTVVTLFQNEPSQAQMRQLERLHHDFEEANRSFLQRTTVDATKLAYPFLVFVQKKYKA